jgi:carbon monoxide dehydrogenase subunit G
VAEVQYATTAKLPIETIWEFVREMDHWGPWVAGYQSHVKESETDSVWTLKGDLGSLSRTLRFKVRITEWAGPERVSFELAGLNEKMDGRGQFRMERVTADGVAAASAAPLAPRKGLVARFLEWLVALFYKPERRAVTAPAAGETRLTFQLVLTPGGPMGPMINAMIQPAMAVAAEDLANRIVGHLEQQGDSA